MDFETITFGVEENVATITLDRPDALNSFNDAMATEMAYVWGQARDTDSIHAVVLQANGDRAFSTGLDIRGDSSWLFRQNVWNNVDPGVTLSPKTHHKLWKPVVVAVQGLCAGGAQYFLNEADIIICSENAEFFDPHANVGIVSALEPIGMLNRGVPLGDVLRWALMGNEERISAETALRLGLVTEVVPGASLRARAREIAVSIAGRNPKAIQGTVRAIWESLDMTRTIAIQNGLSYTEIGNYPPQPPVPREKRTPNYR